MAVHGGLSWSKMYVIYKIIVHHYFEVFCVSCAVLGAKFCNKQGIIVLIIELSHDRERQMFKIC